ncbi:MAG: hypothetical protein Q9212_000539 [Teloschistes hypoglaucus]
METTFISIHDLSLDARLLYASQSIVDILGYTPQEVVGKSCWEYFHPDEIPFARAVHGRGVQLDKAAVLNYCQVKNKDGRWVGCECVFTIVHDVIIACTSIFRRGLNSQKRATAAPVIRRLFSSSPRDPRYHMLSYISNKFSQDIPRHLHEPRAALFLNRFTRTLTIMYATNGLADILGITAEELNGKSFYYCIQENCLKEAVKCLESAKANDSIAYLRFWFRDPRRDDHADRDERMTDANSSGDEDDGGVHLSELMDEDGSEHAMTSDSSVAPFSANQSRSGQESQNNSMDPNSRSSSGNSTDLGDNSNEAMFDRPVTTDSPASSFSLPTPERDMQSFRQCQIELEAVVSCASDGLVVVLRKARPTIPQTAGSRAEPVEHPYTNGLFASPWAHDPLVPHPQQRPMYAQQNHYRPDGRLRSTATEAGIPTVEPPPTQTDLMNTIREVAVFAWALTGINGSLAQYSRGKPLGESQPPDGLPIWNAGPVNAPEDQGVNGQYRHMSGTAPGQTDDQCGNYTNDRYYNRSDYHADRQEPWMHHQQQHISSNGTNGYSTGVDGYEWGQYNPTSSYSRQDWADDEEFDDPSALPPQTITTNKDGTKTIITYSFNDSGKKVKTTRRIRSTVVRETVNPRVAERRAWAKFGLEKGHAVGPSLETTTVGENIIFRPSVTWKKDAKDGGKDGEKDGAGAEVPGGGMDKNSLKQQLKDKKVKCRICDGEHYTMKCPFKDTLAPDGVDGAVGSAAGGANGAEGVDGDGGAPKEGGLGSGGGGYVPPHLRNKGGVTGEKMGGKYERDDLATLRVTNVSEFAEENDLREIFERFGRVTRVFLAKDRETQRAKGFAFISFADRGDAAKACEKIDGYGYGHLILRVEFAKRAT